MENIYEIGQSPRNSPTIIIRRKPSQIPWRIDWELMQIAGMGELDGPNSRVTYEFLSSERFSKGKAFLDRCGWKQKE